MGLGVSSGVICARYLFSLLGILMLGSSFVLKVTCSLTFCSLFPATLQLINVLKAIWLPDLLPHLFLGWI